MSDAQPIPVRMWNGYPYLSLSGVGAIVMVAIVWGSHSQRLEEVEKKQRESDARVETISQAVATKGDVKRVEDRLDTVINMLVSRNSKELP